MWVDGDVSEMGYFNDGGCLYLLDGSEKIILGSYLWVHNGWCPTDKKLGGIRLGENGMGNVANFQCMLDVHDSYTGCYYWMD